MIIIHLPALQVSFPSAQGPHINNVRVLIYIVWSKTGKYSTGTDVD